MRKLSKEWTSANTNNLIRFKLTKLGRERIAEINREHPAYQTCPLHYEEDDEGWCKTELWEFAWVFGPTFGNGFELTVETGIQLRAIY
jgi:hypothetical protein